MDRLPRSDKRPRGGPSLASARSGGGGDEDEYDGIRRAGAGQVRAKRTEPRRRGGNRGTRRGRVRRGEARGIRGALDRVRHVDRPRRSGRVPDRREQGHGMGELVVPSLMSRDFAPPPPPRTNDVFISISCARPHLRPNFRHLSLSLPSLSPSTTKVHPFLATDCAYVADGPGDGDDGGGDAAVVGGRDVEEQSVRRMTLSEVREAVVRGMFAEVQWSNTVALGILHLTNPPPSDGRWEKEEDD